MSAVTSHGKDITTKTGIVCPEASHMERRDDAVVLIVDDNRDLADLYANWLSEAYTVKTAYDGREALARLDASVDIVLLDRRMPGLSGEEVLAEMREYGFGCQIALVTSTAMDYADLPLGFDDYLHKPATEAALRSLVESLLIRIDYSDKLQEYFGLLSKRVALQTAKDADEFADHPDVRELDERIADLRAEIDGLLAGFSEEDYRAVFSSLPSDDDSEATSHESG